MENTGEPIVLPHEQFLNENNVDFKTLPSNITARLDVMEEFLDRYESLEDDDDELFNTILTESQDITDMLSAHVDSLKTQQQQPIQSSTQQTKKVEQSQQSNVPKESDDDDDNDNGGWGLGYLNKY